MRSVVLFLSLLAAATVPRPADALVVLGWHGVRDRIADGDADTSAISTRNLAMQLDWLRAHGYVPVTAQAVRDARAGRGTLPANAVLLTFDGADRSTWTHAFPLLRAFGYPALVALPTARIGASPAGGTLSWDDVKAMQASGLVEFASAGHDLATAIVADPQGDRLPAVDARRWSGGYESDADYRERLRRDLAASADLIERHTGRRPAAVVWPAGYGNAEARGVAESLGMPLVLDAGVRSGTADLRYAGYTRLDADPARAPRLVMHENPGASDLAYELRRDAGLDGIRAVRVNLDDIVGTDDAATTRNVDALVERIRGIRPSHVLLQGVSDTNGDGRADAAYFPGTTLPLRADLFTHVAARLQERAGVEVVAWMPSGVDASTVAADALRGTPARGIAYSDAAASANGRPGTVTMRVLPADRPVADAGSDFAIVMLPRIDARTDAIDRLVGDVVRTPGGPERTLFLIDAGDAAHPLSPASLEAQARRVVAAGGRHVGYAQDLALKDQPPLEPARAAISARAFPYLER